MSARCSTQQWRTLARLALTPASLLHCRRDFYGPLLACVSATKSAFNAMVRQHSLDGEKPDARAFHQACLRDPQGAQGTAYR